MAHIGKILPLQTIESHIPPGGWLHRNNCCPACVEFRGKFFYYSSLLNPRVSEFLLSNDPLTYVEFLDKAASNGLIFALGSVFFFFPSLKPDFEGS